MIYIVEEIHHVGVGIVHHTLIIIRQHVYQQIFDHILGIGRLEFTFHAKTHVVHVKHVVRVIAERSGLGSTSRTFSKNSSFAVVAAT